MRVLPKIGWSALLLCGAGAGCEFIANVDRGGIGATGDGGSTGLGGMVLGIGGLAGSGGADMTPDASAGMGASGNGGSSGNGGGSGNGGSSGASGSGGVSADAPLSDVPTDSPLIGNDASACVRALPAGWTLTVFNPAATSCPPAYADHQIFSGSPVIGAAACTCGCAVFQAGTCQGTLSVLIAPGQGVDTCVTTLASEATVNGSNCIAAVAPRVEAAMASFSGGGQGGSCTNSTAADPSQLTKPTAQHYCDVPIPSSDAVCNGTPPAGYSACIVSSGSPACPAPFTRVVYHVEDDMTLNCSPCTGCTVAGTCPSGTLNLFSDANCAISVGSVPANNSCVVLTAAGEEVLVNSITYAATPSSTCTEGTSTPATTIVGPRTICCR